MDDPVHRSPADHRRDRETGHIVYPCFSRRSGGLSIGVNLFPDRKACNFDCPYCEVFPFEARVRFDVDDLVHGLRGFFERGLPRFGGERVRDICLSGNGEPTLSPHFMEALDAAIAARDQYAPEADAVVITNSTRLGDAAFAPELGRRVDESRVRVWAKLDAGNEAAYGRMNRSAVPFADLVAGFRTFSKGHDTVVQSMFCALDGVPPSEADLEDYVALAASIAREGGKVTEFHLYTQARPSPEHRTSAVGGDVLRGVAARLKAKLEARLEARLPARRIPIRLFDERGEMDASGIAR